eukprot:3056185-Amphidinium_carterae.1
MGSDDQFTTVRTETITLQCYFCGQSSLGITSVDDQSVVRRSLSCVTMWARLQTQELHEIQSRAA